MGRDGFKNKRGIVLLSHKASPAIPSPMRSLTAEFGKGSGVSFALWTPQIVSMLKSQSFGDRPLSFLTLQSYFQASSEQKGQIECSSYIKVAIKF